MADMQPAIVEPAFVAAPTAMAPIDPDAETDADLTPVDGPTTEVPEDFDLSRFGPNVRAAYCGPTVDNPSLSLKHRLRKATAMDQMERNADAERDCGGLRPGRDAGRGRPIGRGLHARACEEADYASCLHQLSRGRPAGSPASRSADKTPPSDVRAAAFSRDTEAG